jgi:DNA-binding transcriptional LysR family regulator
VNYRQIEIFAAIMEAASITEAACRLRLSQPAVSKSLRSLEEELGLRLFVRAARGLQATDEARELYAEASRVIMGFTHLDAFAHNLQQLRHARIVISAMTALCLKWLPQVVAEFVRQYPEISLELQSRTSPETVRLIGQGEVDIGISQARLDDMSVRRRKVFGLATICAVPSGHPLSQKPILRAQDFQGQTIISLSAGDECRRLFEAMLAAQRVTFRSTTEVALGATLCAMVDAGCGIGIVDVETARAQTWRNVVFRRIEPAITVSIYAMQNIHKPQSLAVRRFIGHILRRAPRRWGDERAPNGRGASM